MKKTLYYVVYRGKIEVTDNIITAGKIKKIDSSVKIYARCINRKKIVMCSNDCEPNIMIITESFGQKKVYFANCWDVAIKKIPKYERVLDIYDI